MNSAVVILSQITDLIHRETLSRLATRFHAEALNHLGFGEPAARFTLADAIERRDWRLWQALAMSLVMMERRLYAGQGLDLNKTIYALDCLSYASSLRAVLGAVYLPSIGSSTIRFVDDFVSMGKLSV